MWKKHRRTGEVKGLVRGGVESRGSAGSLHSPKESGLLRDKSLGAQNTGIASRMMVRETWKERKLEHKNDAGI